MSKLYLKSNPTLKDIQAYVEQMEKERGFSDEHVSQVCLLLVEEVGELLKSIRKSHVGMGIDVNKKYSDDASEEIADIIIVLSAIANRLGIDMEEAFRAKEEVNKTRQWG